LERKIGSFRKCAFSSSKVRAALKKQTAVRSANSNRDLQEQSYYGSENHPASADIKFIRKTRLNAKVLLWLAVSEYVFFKSGLAVNKELSRTS
jgi:hypothetical protein